MRNSKYILLFFLMTGTVQSFAQNTDEPKVSWNGYTQLRFSTNFNDVNTFAMRRMKLWVNSAPGFSQHWGFHVQTTISSNQDEKFFLQDVLAFYKQGQFRINMGQFIPQYSLQRFQPDFEIPLTERAGVINALIPNGTLGVRDIGVEAQYSTKEKEVQAWLGAFNGYGIKEYQLNNSGFLLTQKTTFNILNNHFHTGYSVMFRQADQLNIPGVLPDSVSYTGNDFRFNLFAHWHTKRFNIQAEYLQANLDGKMANGWYLLAHINYGENQVVASWNFYNDIIESSDYLSTIHLGYNYLLNEDKLKIILDNTIQIKEGRIMNYIGVIQLQIFFS